MHAASIVPSATVLLALLLVLERKQRPLPRLVVKATLSSLFVATALLQPHGWSEAAWAMLAGLALCLLGDVSLAIPGKKAFMAGLVFFLLGHVAYTVAFFVLAPTSPWTLVGALVAVSASWTAWRWLRPSLGSMRVPVAAYILAISTMVVTASSVAAHDDLGVGARALIPSGAVAFYLSDLFVARQRFVREGFVNRLVGLPLYYSGQFLLAFSLGSAA